MNGSLFVIALPNWISNVKMPDNISLRCGRKYLVVMPPSHDKEGRTHDHKEGRTHGHKEGRTHGHMLKLRILFYVLESQEKTRISNAFRKFRR